MNMNVTRQKLGLVIVENIIVSTELVVCASPNIQLKTILQSNKYCYSGSVFRSLCFDFFFKYTAQKYERKTSLNAFEPFAVCFS